MNINSKNTLRLNEYDDLPTKLKDDIEFANELRLKERGWTIRYGWDQHAPEEFVTWESFDESEEKFWSIEKQYGWQDHMKMLKRKGDETIYISEPYHLEPHYFKMFADLLEKGWYVTINPEFSLHNVTRTIPIWISRSNDISHFTP